MSMSECDIDIEHLSLLLGFAGIYYVDDPHATFRDESERRAQDRVSGEVNVCC